MSLVRRNQYENERRKEEKENFMFSVHFKHIIINILTMWAIVKLLYRYFITLHMLLSRRLYTSKDMMHNQNLKSQ